MLKLASRFGQDGGWLSSWGSWTTAFVQEGQSDLAPCGASNFLVADGDIVGPYFWSCFCDIRLAFRPYIFWVPLYFSLDPWNGHCWDICFFMGAFCIDIMMRPGGYLKRTRKHTTSGKYTQLQSGTVSFIFFRNMMRTAESPGPTWQSTTGTNMGCFPVQNSWIYPQHAAGFIGKLSFQPGGWLGFTLFSEKPSPIWCLISLSTMFRYLN
jgi:hypothetical protein